MRTSQTIPIARLETVTGGLYPYFDRYRNCRPPRTDGTAPTDGNWFRACFVPAAHDERGE